MVDASGINSRKKRTEKNQLSGHRLRQRKIPKIKTKNNSNIDRFRVAQAIGLKFGEVSKFKKQKTRIPGLVREQDSRSMGLKLIGHVVIYMLKGKKFRQRFKDNNW